jgi:chemotaxis protein CheD
MSFMIEGAIRTIHVIQGDHHVADTPGLILTTILGSCVAACLFDPDRRIGGMNHFLLPDVPGVRDIRHASAAMEELINSLLKAGARRDRLIAKLFGGASMIKGLPDIGRRNGEAAQGFLKVEGIRIVAQSLGGHRARRIRFWPESGRAQQLLLHHAPEPAAKIPAPATTGSTIEIF